MKPGFRLWSALLLAGACGLAGAAQSGRSPLDAAAPVAATLYVSPFAGYMLFDDQAVGDWRRVNDALALAEQPEQPGQASSPPDAASGAGSATPRPHAPGHHPASGPAHSTRQPAKTTHDHAHH